LSIYINNLKLIILANGRRLWRVDWFIRYLL